MIVFMSRISHPNSIPLFRVKYLTWNRLIDNWINTTNPSPEIFECLDWCDLFIGGLDLTISYMYERLFFLRRHKKGLTMIKKQHSLWNHHAFSEKVSGLHATPGDEDIYLASNCTSGITWKQDTSYEETGHDLT